MESSNFETFTVHLYEDIAILKLTEKRIYMQTSDKFGDEIIRFFESAVNSVIFDLSQVSVMNSAALGVLIGAQNEIEKRDGRLSVAGLQPLMKDIFERMRLELLFEIDDSVQVARERLEKPQK